MLVLSRQSGQTIVIGDDIEVTVVAIRGGNVRLGIEAPRQVPVNRREIYDRIVRNMHTGPLGNATQGNP